MRLTLLVLLGSIATGASAQAFNQHVSGYWGSRQGVRSADLGAAYPTYWVDAYTPTMRRADEDRRAKGLAYIAANARTAADVKNLARNCRKFTAVPGYCAIPEMRVIARLRR